MSYFIIHRLTDLVRGLGSRSAGERPSGPRWLRIASGVLVLWGWGVGCGDQIGLTPDDTKDDDGDAAGGRTSGGDSGTGGTENMGGEPEPSQPEPTGGVGGAGGKMPVEEPMAPSCEDGEQRCDDTCIDPSTDSSYCGALCEEGDRGEVCGEGQFCEGGTCRLDCPEGRIDCFGECIDPLTNDAYCGASAECLSSVERGEFCDSAETCVAGTCHGWSAPQEVTNSTGDFCTAMDAEGSVLWGMSIEQGGANSTGYRLLFSGDRQFGAYRSFQPLIAYSMDCVFEPELGNPAIAVSAANTIQWSVGVLDREAGGIVGGYAYPSDPTRVLLVANRNGSGTTFLRNDNGTAGLGATDFDSSGDQSALFSVHGAELPETGTADQVRGLLVSGWKHVAAGDTRLRIVKDNGACCDAVRVSTPDAYSAREPIVKMDDEQNVFAVWAETGGSNWVMRALRFASEPSKLPNEWQRTDWILDSGDLVSAEHPAFATTADGRAFAAWVHAEGSARWIAYRFYDPTTASWSDLGELRVGPHSSFPHLAVTMNQAGHVLLTYNSSENALWSAIYKDSLGGFSEPVSHARHDAGYVRVENQLAPDGVGYVFWQVDDDSNDLGMSLLAR